MTDKISAATTKEYRVLPGMKHYASTEKGLVKYTEGQIVELTDYKYAIFADKFTPTKETGDEINEKILKEDSKTFKVVSAGGDKYNVFSKKNSKKAINEKPISKDSAEKLAAEKEAA